MRPPWKLQSWNSDMNRFFIFLIILISTKQTLLGQNNTYSLEWNGGAYFEVKNLSGEISPSNFVKLRLGTTKTNIQEWMITATVRGIERKYENVRESSSFPLNMLSLRCVSKSGSSNVDNINKMFVWNTFTGLNNEIELVNFQSLIQDGYNPLLLDFELKVEGGEYLRQIPRWTTYYFRVEYRLYKRNNSNQPWKQEQSLLMTSDFFHFAINIDPNQLDPVYSITVVPEAMLEFSTISDYVNGTSKTYYNGLKISATDGYEVKVKSIQNQFTSATTSATFPLDMVSLQLGNGNGIQQPVSLSTVNQLILEGVSTNGQVLDYDVIYSARAIDESNLFINTDQNYSTQLMFEITTR